MLIDAHTHANWLDLDIEGIVRNMDRAGIDVAWLLTWETYFHREADLGNYCARVDPLTNPSEPVMPFRTVVEACRRHPDRFVPFFAPHPKAPYALERLQSAVEMYGVRGVGEWKFQLAFNDPDCVRMHRFCGKKGLPVIFHMQSARMPMKDPDAWINIWYAGGPHEVEDAFRQCPETVFVGHAPGFWRELSDRADEDTEHYPSTPTEANGRLVRWLEEYPKLHCDLSAGSCLRGLKRLPDGGRAFLTRFADRMLFARDQFDDVLYEHLKSLRLKPAVWRKIASENALRLVPLPRRRR